MGRHSAPDDDTVDVGAATTTTLDLGPLDLDGPRGRHSGDDDAAPGVDEQQTQMIAVVDPDVAADDTQVTDVLVPPEPLIDEIVPLEEAPAKLSRADRRAQQKAQKKADKAAAVPAPVAAPAPAPPTTAPPTPAPPPAPAPAKAEVAPSPAKTKKRKKDGETDTQADLRVLRENSAVRARSIAGVLVSFLLYTVVMIVIGQTAMYLLWIWIPIVVAGVLVGVVLDLAHRQPKDSAVSSPPDEPLG
jgi:hypothetical protein